MINSGTSYHITKQRSYQRLAVPCQKDLAARLNKLQWTKEAQANIVAD